MYLGNDFINLSHYKLFKSSNIFATHSVGEVNSHFESDDIDSVVETTAEEDYVFPDKHGTFFLVEYSCNC